MFVGLTALTSAVGDIPGGDGSGADASAAGMELASSAPRAPDFTYKNIGAVRGDFECRHRLQQ
jgi:hypothetical protein